MNSIDTIDRYCEDSSGYASSTLQGAINDAYVDYKYGNVS